MQIHCINIKFLVLYYTIIEYVITTGGNWVKDTQVLSELTLQLPVSLKLFLKMVKIKNI